jgi:predicted HTH transcriptional regulator
VPVFASIEPCLAFIKKNIALGATIGEVYREDRWEYPLEAIREAIINAVIHRDYAVFGSDIKVAIYDDMLEITSPGPLPDLLSFEDLGTGRSEIRNRVLAPIFKDMKLIEAWGSGIQKMKIELEDYPEIELVLTGSRARFSGAVCQERKSWGRVRAESGQSQGRVRAESGQSQERHPARVTARVGKRKNSGSTGFRSFIKGRNL